MTYTEETVAFTCAGESLFGILTRPALAGNTAVIVVVGGPQTRVGSHRQFVLLARVLATTGYAVLRFDARGRGDSGGLPTSFADSAPDIGAAVDALQKACPSVDKFVLWGLCDAAAAALLYCDATGDARIRGLCLLNPWVRSETSLARTQVKHYYGQRLKAMPFWQKLLSGRLNVLNAGKELLHKIHQASLSATPLEDTGFQVRMANGLRNFSGQVLLLLSGDDYTAKEFLEYTASADKWRGLLDSPNLTRIDITEADHTFSSQVWRSQVEQACIDWLAQLQR